MSCHLCSRMHPSHQTTISIIVTGIRWKLLSCSHSTRAGSYCKSVTSLILRMPGMSLYPMERHPMQLIHSCKPHPQVRILYLGKAFSLPVLKPSFIDGIDHIGRIAVDMYLGILPFYRLESLYHGKKFHPVVGGHGKSSGHFLLDTCTFEHNPIAAGTGIAARSSVCV